MHMKRLVIVVMIDLSIRRITPSQIHARVYYYQKANEHNNAKSRQWYCSHGYTTYKSVANNDPILMIYVHTHMSLFDMQDKVLLVPVAWYIFFT